MKAALEVKVILIAAALCLAPMAGAERCVAPDNGGGTVSLPANCPYVNEGGTLDIIDGLPPGTTLESDFWVESFFDVFVEIGGPLGGEVITCTADMRLQMTGTGALTGYSRDIMFPVSLVMNLAPRIPGEKIQSFPCELQQLSGTLMGDPDFDLLELSAGNEFGLPSPGHTTLTQLPDGRWNVDSFFAITYRIEFTGAPGSPLSGYSGVTTGTVRAHQGEDGWDHCDVFNITFDATGWMIEGGGTGHDGGTFYYYPNTEWWNEWYYDGVLDLTRAKNVMVTFNITPTDVGADATVAINYSSPDYPPGTGVPPIPPISPEDEADWIVREPIFVGQDLTEPVTQTVLFQIIDFNPEWVSIDVMGTNVVIEGDICHVCLDVQFPEGEPPVEGEGEQPWGARPPEREKASLPSKGNRRANRRVKASLKEKQSRGSTSR